MAVGFTSVVFSCIGWAPNVVRNYVCCADLWSYSVNESNVEKHWSLVWSVSCASVAIGLSEIRLLYS